MISVLESFSGCAQYAAEWNRVATAESGLPYGLGPFCLADSTALAFDVLGRGREARIFVSRSGSDEIAVAPCCLQRRVSAFVPYRELGLIPNLYPGRAGLVFSDAQQTQAARMIEEILLRDKAWDVFNVTLVEGSKSEELFQQGIRKSRLKYQVFSTVEIPYIEFPPSWDDFFNGLSKKFRYTIRSSEQQLRDLGRLELKTYQLPEHAAQFIEAYESIEKRSWKNEAGSAITSSGTEREFHIRFAELTGVVGQRTGFVLYLDNCPIAHIYGVAIGQVFCDLKESFDQEYSRYSPGSVLKAMVFRDLGDSSIDRWDFVGPGEFHKWRWTSKKYLQKNYVIYANTIAGRVSRLRGLTRKLFKPDNSSRKS